MNVYHNAIYTKGEDVIIHYEFQNYIVSGVADGHGGSAAANMCKDNIKIIQDVFDPRSVDKSLSLLFSTLHEKCRHLECNSGCTLTIVIIDKNTGEYTCANVGDSLAIHVKVNTFMYITSSHRLQDNACERNKLKEHVHFLKNNSGESIGPPRLFPGGLACSRSIGDHDCKYITPEPHIYSDKLESNDSIIICTDGVWDCVKVSKILKIARDTYNPEFIGRLCVRKNTKDDSTSVIITKSKLRTSMHKNLFKLFTYHSQSPSSSTSDD